MRAAILSVFFCGLCFGVVGFAVAGVRAGLGVTLGGLIATVNLLVFARVGEAFLARKGNTAPWGLVAVLKMLLLFGGVWLILQAGFFSPLSLVAGYAALPVGITVASLFGPHPKDDGPDFPEKIDEVQNPRAHPDVSVIQGRRTVVRKDPP